MVLRAGITIQLFVLSIFVFSQPGIQANFIKVDQFGYQPTAHKVAVLSNPEIGYNAAATYAPGSTFEVREAGTNTLVYTGTIQQWNGGSIHTQSGDRGWWFDFSSVQTIGSYYIYDPVNDFSSYEFEIKEDIYFSVLEASGRMFYYNRCGIEKTPPYADVRWVDALSFSQDQNAKYIDDPNNSALYRDVRGGWFDAGDFNKYVNYTNNTLHNLLWAYQQNPTVFPDTWNIPESGNGTPDILDEIKWELDWLFTMVNPDGTVHNKVGSISYDENTDTPPSINNFPRYYGPTCSSSEITVASVFAHSAIIFSQFPSMVSYADSLQNQAQNIWQQVLVKLNTNTLDLNCDDQSITSSDSDETIEEQRSDALAAAIYLFALTGDNAYNTYIIQHSTDSGPLGTGFWDNYFLQDIDALLYYTTLPGADFTLSQNIQNSFMTDVNNNWSNYFGWDQEDLYRAYVPDWVYNWGSNEQKSNFGVMNYLINYYGLSNDEGNLKRGREILHYLHGTNPLNLCYVSNMYEYGAEKCANEIYHNWFADGSVWDNALNENGPPPGYLVGGPNQEYNANTNLVPPYNQPMQKSYLDFNDDWPNNSWEITEPAIYYNAIYLRLLSQQVSLPIGEVTLELKTYLEGPFNSETQLMNDALRSNNEIPLTEPYTDLGYSHVIGGGEATTSTVLNISGANAVVDWVVVELHDAVIDTVILATQSALLQRDGDVVSVDGSSPVVFSEIGVGEVIVILRHRNHFGIRALDTYGTDQPIVIDFTDPSTNVFGLQSMVDIGSVKAMIAGDANRDGQINAVDKNNHWRVENGQPFDYFNSKADFNLDGNVNPVDKNGYWRTNNSKIEQVE